MFVQFIKSKTEKLVTCLLLVCCCRFLETAFSNLDLLYFKLLNLAGHRHWEGINKSDELWNLVMGDLTCAEFSDFDFRRRHTGFQTYPRKNGFTGFPVWDPHDCDVGNLGMRHEEFFDLARKNIFSAANQHFLRTACNFHVAAFEHDSEIPGMQPAVGIDGFRRRFRLSVITFHYQVAARANLSLFPDMFGGTGYRIRNLHFNVRDRPAQGRDPQIE